MTLPSTRWDPERFSGLPFAKSKELLIQSKDPPRRRRTSINQGVNENELLSLEVSFEGHHVESATPKLYCAFLVHRSYS